MLTSMLFFQERDKFFGFNYYQHFFGVRGTIGRYQVKDKNEIDKEHYFCPRVYSFKEKKVVTVEGFHETPSS